MDNFTLTHTCGKGQGWGVPFVQTPKDKQLRSVISKADDTGPNNEKLIRPRISNKNFANPGGPTSDPTIFRFYLVFFRKGFGVARGLIKKFQTNPQLRDQIQFTDNNLSLHTRVQ